MSNSKIRMPKGSERQSRVLEVKPCPWLSKQNPVLDQYHKDLEAWTLLKKQYESEILEMPEYMVYFEVTESFADRTAGFIGQIQSQPLAFYIYDDPDLMFYPGDRVRGEGVWGIVTEVKQYSVRKRFPDWELPQKPKMPETKLITPDVAGRILQQWIEEYNGGVLLPTGYWSQYPAVCEWRHLINEEFFQAPSCDPEKFYNRVLEENIVYEAIVDVEAGTMTLFLHEELRECDIYEIERDIQYW